MSVRIDRNQTFDRDGNLISEELVEVDTTAETNRQTIDAAIEAALAELATYATAPDVPAVPAGTLSTAQLSTGLRALRDATQANRDGIKRVAATLKQTIRLVRGDFDGID